MSSTTPCLVIGGLIVGLSLASTPVEAQALNCSQVKEGKFEVEEEGGSVWVITRKRGIQREENESMGVVVEFLVEWIDDCSFRLLPYNVIRNDARLEMGDGVKFIVEIVEVSDDRFIQETTVWKTGQYIVSEAKIIKQ